MRGFKRGLAAASVALVGLSILPASPAWAQIPETFTNLQQLPKEIQQSELVGVMRGWAVSLGVRCSHCHVGPDNLQGMDFANDEKATKRAAREMLKMVTAINGQYLAGLPEGAAKGQTVACFTCHRGQPRPPQALGELLAETIRAEGVDAGIDRYRTLRAEHYGSGVYDFSAATLNNVAQGLAEGGKLDEAMALLEVNVEQYPQSADAHAGLGFGLLQKGDRAGAQESFDKALAIDPDNRIAHFGLQRLAATAEPPPEGEEKPPPKR